MAGGSQIASAGRHFFAANMGVSGMASRRRGALGSRLVAFVLLVASGCGSSQPAADVSQADWAKSHDAASSAPAQPTIEVIDTAKLNPLGDPLAALDDGRLTIAPPADWVLGPRNKDRLAMFQLEPDDAYPSIMLTVSEVQDAVSLSAENVAAFVAELQSQLEAEMAAKKFTLAEPVKGLQIGDFLGVQYMRTAVAKGTRLERCFLETVQAGRRYQLEMRTRAGSLHRFRPYLYAVAAGMKFGPAAP
ncbi:MAG: hypothetical protein K2Y37_03205 [Pirellulales bacterium]|nr:hypothetical protein [Pirellulales bacterium]